MNAKQMPAWVSYYLYYETEADGLLVNKLWPLVQKLRDKRLIQQFFFIRYTDAEGPHIRLRALPVSTRARTTVMRQVKKEFPAAKFAAYIPETERYGGPIGMQIAEQLFEASSTAVLKTLAAAESWNYRRALAVALQMHIGMLQALGVSRMETVALCKHLTQSAHGGEFVDLFEQGLAAQRQTVSPGLRAIWNAYESNVRLKDAWFTEWHQAMTEVGAEIRQASNAHKLVLPNSPQHDDALWALYESYLHMTNNRLGVANRDEAFLAYILQDSLKNE